MHSILYFCSILYVRLHLKIDVIINLHITSNINRKITQTRYHKKSIVSDIGCTLTSGCDTLSEITLCIMLSTNLIPHGVRRLAALNFGLDPLVPKVLQFYRTSGVVSIMLLSLIICYLRGKYYLTFVATCSCTWTSSISRASIEE